MNWKEELKQLKLENMREKTPESFVACGGYEMKIIPYKDTTANGLTRCIYDWLKFQCHYVNRINTQGQARVEKVELAFGNSRNLVHWTQGQTNLGTADIDSIINGKPVKIEVKIGKDKMSEDQHKEKTRIEKADGFYFVARDMESFITWYQQTF